MTTTEDGGGWSRWRSGCSRKCTVAPDRAGIWCCICYVMYPLFTCTSTRLVYLLCWWWTSCS